MANPKQLSRFLWWNLVAAVLWAISFPINQYLENTFVQQGDQALSQGEHDQAIAHYGRALWFSRDKAELYANRGQVYDRKAQFQQTLAMRAAQSQGDGMTQPQPGSVKIDPAHSDQAIAEYTLAIQNNPNDIDAYIRRGTAYAMKGDFARAMADQNTAIQLNPTYPIAYASRGDVHYQRGQYDGALVDYSYAIQLDNRYAYAHFNRMYLYMNAEQYDLAIADCNRLIVIGESPYNSIAEVMKQTAIQRRNAQ
jgi:tetratricopeptide (TPR) repeat protein